MEIGSEYAKLFIEKFGTIIIDGWNQKMGFGLEDYIGKHICDLAYVKTFLHRNEPIHITDLYYPIRLGSRNKNEIIIKSIDDIFSKNNFIVVKGTAGSGKSTLLKYLFYDSITTQKYIPLMINLREIRNVKFRDFVIDKLITNDLAQNDKIAKKLLKSGSFVIFLDGYDEVGSQYDKELILSINQFVSQYIDNNYIITTRPDERVEALDVFSVYSIIDLNDNDIESFIKKVISDEVLIDKIINTISEEKNDSIVGFLRNPLLLSLYILTYKINSKIPVTSSEFYSRVVHTLFIEHDSISKLGFEREYKTQLSESEFKKLLAIYSFITYFGNSYFFYKNEIYDTFELIKEKLDIVFNNKDILDDLTKSISIWIKDGSQYSFVHRSLQEYFAAKYIKNSDDKIKSKVMEKILLETIKSSTHLRLIEIYSEIDELSYKKYFLKEILSHYISFIFTSDIITDLRNFFDYQFSSYSILYESENNKNLSSGFRTVTKNRVINFKLRPFSKGRYGEWFWFIMNFNNVFLDNKEKLEEYIINDMPDVSDRHDFEMQIDIDRFISEEVELLRATDIIDEFESLKKDFIGYYTETTRFVENYKSGNNDIVDMVLN